MAYRGCCVAPRLCRGMYTPTAEGRGSVMYGGSTGAVRGRIRVLITDVALRQWNNPINARVWLGLGVGVGLGFGTGFGLGLGLESAVVPALRFRVG